MGDQLKLVDSSIGQSAEVHKVDQMSALDNPSATRRKELGAFYTPPVMAKRLVEWAIRSQDDHVLDPSFGGLVFLRAAMDQLRQLGTSTEDAEFQLHGMELDAEAYKAATAADGGLLASGLQLGDFFTCHPNQSIPTCQAVVGNPPYIRYQDFKHSAPAAHRITEQAGIRLTRLASSWAPFLIHATAFVAPGGRMAQVLPAELIHAQYAGGILDFLRRRFARVTIVVFDERVFPGALEEVVLLLADGRGDDCDADIQLLSYGSLDDLDLEDLRRAQKAPSSSKATGRLGQEKLLLQLLSADAQGLYRGLQESSEVRRLSDIAKVDIGAVTGANDFFLLTDQEATRLSRELLRPAVSKAVHIRGARFGPEDHAQLGAAGQKSQILVANAKTPSEVLATAEDYFKEGEKEGIDTRYKCRTRRPWWAVPIPKSGVADLLLTYCVNDYPRLVVNDAGVLQTNTIHGVNANAHVNCQALAAGFYNSLTLLSAELVGRSYGGGVLKLEPTEAESLLIPPIESNLAKLLPEVDRLVRRRDLESVLELIDPLVLGAGLSLSKTEIREIRGGALRLRQRRKSRNSRPRTGHLALPID
jgi:adenine-specific DNA methylase